MSEQTRIHLDLPFSRSSMDDHPCVTGRTDFGHLARLLVSAHNEIWPSTDPRFEPDPKPLLNAWRLLESTEHAPRLARAVAEHLHDADRGVRYVALQFFASFPDAGGSDDVLDLLADGQRRTALGQEPHERDGYDEWVGGASVDAALAVLRELTLRNHPRALELSRVEVLRDENWTEHADETRRLLGVLMHRDSRWVIEHAARLDVISGQVADV